MISKTLALGIDGEEWFERTAIGLAEDRDRHTVDVLIALLLAAAIWHAGLFSWQIQGEVIGTFTVIINPQAKIVCKENSASKV